MEHHRIYLILIVWVDIRKRRVQPLKIRSPNSTLYASFVFEIDPRLDYKLPSFVLDVDFALRPYNESAEIRLRKWGDKREFELSHQN